jgi:iron(III) transport system substrate-binding protein
LSNNHQLVKKEQAPKGYNDLLDDKWKGSLTIDLEPERALLTWLVAWGEAKTRDFVQKLLANGASVRRGHTLQAQLLCAGEFKAAVELYPDAILRMQQKGCPATIVFPNPTPALAGGNYGINVHAPHPHSAALFVDFVLSADGANILSGRAAFQHGKARAPYTRNLPTWRRKACGFSSSRPSGPTKWQNQWKKS